MQSVVPQSRPSQESLIATFELGTAGAFGIDTTLIQEVVMVGEITCVHHTADYVAGIRNLRGRLITVIDLVMRLGAGPASRGPDSRILITDCDGEPVGLLVDRVADAISLEASELEPVPSNMTDTQLKAIRGVFRKGSCLVALLDTKLVLGTEFGRAKTLIGEESKAGQP